MKIYDIMNQISVIDEDLTLREAAEIMDKEGIGSLVFVKRGKARGIITERDIVENVNDLDIMVTQIMSRNLITIEMNATIEDAAELMAKHKIKRLIVKDDTKLVGIITSTDILANSDMLNKEYAFF